MSEGVRTPPNGGGFRFKVRAPRDFYGGLALIALAIIAIWTSGDLPGTHGFAFGPGTAPRLFAGLLAVVGALVALTGLFSTVRQLRAMQSVGPLGCSWRSLPLPA
jgi:putative tricarboxylic transport membrane protein